MSKINLLVSKCLMTLLAVLVVSTLALAQTVSGTVTDSENGEPLIGANVTFVGATGGASTDVDGKYTVNVPDGVTQLKFTYTGYSEQTVDIAGKSTLNVQMVAGELIDEVVVVGYGAIKKTDVTGAVTSVTEKDFNKGVVASPEQLIQGRAAGVQITSASGEPGAAVNIRIRGTSSVVGSNNPLFVVDGVPIDGESTTAGGSAGGLGASAARNPLNFLNPDDIASIDILKDASATAIYGSRGANGVVIITTKSGASGNAGTLDYGYSLGIASISRRYDLLNATDFLSAYADLNGQDAANSLNGGANTDWQDEVFRTGLTHNHNIAFGNADANGDYRFSFSYQDQEGIIKESGLQRITGRINANRRFLDGRLKLGTNLSVSNVNDDNVPITQNSGFEGDLMGNVLKANPTNPVFDVNDVDGDGDTEEYLQLSNTEPNPVALLNLSESFTNTVRALANFNAELELAEGLSFKTVVGLDRSISKRTDAFSSDLNASQIFGIGRVYLNDISVQNTLWENYFNYNTTIGDNVDFTGLVGYSYQRFDRSGTDVQFAQFVVSDLDIMINNLSSGANASGASFKTVDELQSYFARANFSIDDKYVVTATVRADGSTKFGDDNKYGIFPSAAFKWRMIEEDFVPDAFDDLGLRVGYGITGNQAIPHNLYQFRKRYINGNLQDNGEPWSLDNRVLGDIAFKNNDLKWESTAQINIGLDFAFMNYRLSGELNYYNKNTNDLLIQVVSAQPAATPFVWTNLDADIINQGVELALNYVAADNDNLRWNVIGNVAYNNNIVKNFSGLLNTGDIDGQGLTGAFAQRIAQGQPLFAYFLREFGGFDSEGNSTYPNGDVQQFLDGKSPLPTWNLGLTNTFNIGDLDISIFFASQLGHYIYSNTANAFFTAGSLANGRNVTRDVVGNGEGNLNAPDVSTRFLENGSFLRLQNVSIGYNLPVGDSNIFKSLRLFANGQNLFVITGYSGQDPEVNVNKAIDGVPSLGIDYTTYPRARTITLGLNASF